MLWITWIVFALTYLGLAIGKVPGTRMDRAAIALVGATLMLCLGVLTLREAVAADSIDYETLLLLFGMMVLVGFLQLSGVFIRLTNVLLARIRTPHVLLATIIFLSGVLSAFLVNDVVCVAITPLILHLVQKLRFDPLPQLIGLATAANIGSVATITGNPQNMIIGVQSQISYLDFALHLAPIALLGLLVDFFLIALIYRKRLAAKRDPDLVPSQPANAKIGADKHIPHQEKVPDRPIHRWLQTKSVIVAVVTVILFFTGLPIALIAIGAAAVLLVDRIKSEKIYRRIDWSLLLMFTGLFVVVHAFQLNVVNGWDVAHWRWLQTPSAGLLSLASAALSNLVSNVPAVLLFEPVMHAITPAAQSNAWLTLAMSSTLAGNLTILGSVANLIVVESAKRGGVPISFWEYSRVGLPLTLLTLAIGIVWLQFVHY
ncbi:anion transporter [Pseudolysobacter antarcticus]|uniref:Anion transporter n=1 Tax=Pseudolysobacter antarcticus TaxID=2511995 RepID=A0A411HKL6_9GAMM|nr:anion transporter [Pseudolysobacter antarcticus]QBB71038.1 anion transporter [Pseudolysobacter antarcticus]